MKQKITQEYVKELFNYNDGFLYWKVDRGSNKIKGNKAGTINNKGYCVIKINNKKYQAHRIIYLYHNGYLSKIIDHIDRNRQNNKIENLRSATQSQNNRNIKKQQNCSSIYKGVCWRKDNKKWQSYITINKKRYHLGFFKNEKDAAKMYNKIALKVSDKFTNLNIINGDK